MRLQKLVDARSAYLRYLRMLAVHQLNLFSFSYRSVASFFQLSSRSSIAMLDLFIINSQYLELGKVHWKSNIESYYICLAGVTVSPPRERYIYQLLNGYNMGYPGWPSASIHCESTFLTRKVVISDLTLENRKSSTFYGNAENCYVHIILFFTAKSFLKQPHQKALEFIVVEKIMFFLERPSIVMKLMLRFTSQRNKHDSGYRIILHRSRGYIVQGAPKKLEICCLLAPLSGI